MGKSNKIYYEKFLTHLNETGKVTITLSMDEINKIVGKDYFGKNILPDTFYKKRDYWYTHSFAKFLDDNGWKRSTNYTKTFTAVTFYKAGTQQPEQTKKRIIKEPENFSVEDFIINGLSFDNSFVANDNPNSPNYHVIPGHEREKSWNYCYEVFESINKPNPDIDYLCLHLAFYLASWGMYRGSTFLFRNDYKVHEPVVRKIIEYKHLRGQIPTEENIDDIWDLIVFIKTAYGEHNRPTKTLITKIILGTLACVPAYDTYVVKTIKKYKLVSDLNQNSLLSLGKLYKDNERVINSKNTNYPPMKFLDMAFFRESYDGKIDDEETDEK